MYKLPIRKNAQITAAFGDINTSLWKNGHEGLDFVGDLAVYSTCAGTVRVVAYDAAGWGQYVSIGDANGNRHLYCHLVQGSVKVKVGQSVTEDTVIGTMGTTGNSTGVHLHYQVNNAKGAPLNAATVLGIENKRGAVVMSKPAPVTLDNAPDSYAAGAVRKALERGILRGDDRGDLKLHSSVTRQDLLVILDRCGAL